MNSANADETTRTLARICLYVTRACQIGGVALAAIFPIGALMGDMSAFAFLVTLFVFVAVAVGALTAEFLVARPLRRWAAPDQ